MQIKHNKAKKKMLDHSAATKESESKLTTEISEASMTKKSLEKNISGLESESNLNVSSLELLSLNPS